MRQELVVEGRSFRIEATELDITMGPRPERDPDWRFRDRHGHEHSSVDGDWPTLRWVEDEPYWCEMHEEEHEDGHYECIECSEEIKPGMLWASDPYRKAVPGMRSYFIDDREVDEETFIRETAMARAAIEQKPES